MSDKEQVRIVLTDAPGKAMPEHQGKLFAVIGPFDTFGDKMRLQDTLTLVVRGYNTLRSKP